MWNVIRNVIRNDDDDGDDDDNDDDDDDNNNKFKILEVFRSAFGLK